MKDNDIIHIWQLPSKDDNISKFNSYIIIHHNKITYKINVQNLFNHFIDNEKINKMRREMEAIIDTLDETYIDKYTALEHELDEQKELVELVSDDISSEYDNYITELSQSYEILKSIVQELDRDIRSTWDNYNEIREDYSRLIHETNLVNNSDNGASLIGNINDRIINIDNDSTVLLKEYERLSDNINISCDNINEGITSKEQEFIDIMNSECDKIIDIIDHYHHIK